jgi:hypothetical protein
MRRGIASLGDFVDFARRESGKLTYASGGNGSAGHLAGEMFKREAQVDIVHVPYNGGAPSSWPCCRARWIAPSTTWPAQRPTSAPASSRPWP